MSLCTSVGVSLCLVVFMCVHVSLGVTKNKSGFVFVSLGEVLSSGPFSENARQCWCGCSVQEEEEIGNRES